MKAPETVCLFHAFQVLEKSDPVLAEALVEKGLNPESVETLECHRRDDAHLIVTDTGWDGVFFGLIVPDPDYIPF